MTEIDYSAESLFKPGCATEYFKSPKPEPLIPDAGRFDINNAWWLAELSRLIYHNNFFTNDINLGCLRYEIIAYIENNATSTHVVLLKIIQDNPCFVIAFRGSDEIEDWNINARAYQSSFNNKGKVHRGFKKAYLSIREELLGYLNNYPLKTFITGHSLGAALAILACSDIQQYEYFDSCYTFGSPRIGNDGFKSSLNETTIYRVVNNVDVVTTIPINFASIQYEHIGMNYLFNDMGLLQTNISSDEIYTYQKSKLDGIKEYAVSKLFNKDSESIKIDLPSFLADHAPINYVARILNVITEE